jgi:alpha-L-rhamnosidase
MFQVKDFTVEGRREGVVTDRAHPRFSFSLESDEQNVTLKSAILEVNGAHQEFTRQTFLPYDGERLLAFTSYEAKVTALSDHGEKAEKTLVFETGRLATPWFGKWISDPTYSFTEKKVSPKPMLFRKKFTLSKKVKKAVLCSTSLGVYDLSINGKQVIRSYLAPGFTSYEHELMYQTNDVTSLLSESNVLFADVCGGWAVGSFIYTRTNRYDGDRQALLLELWITYEDGTEEVIGSDESFEVSEEGPYRMADLYDGETYDSRIVPENVAFHSAALETLRIHPSILADYGAPIVRQEEKKPIAVRAGKKPGETIFDFGQNFAGVVSLHVKKAEEGQIITVHHAEILDEEGELDLGLLRSAKATATLYASGKEQTYSPKFTYMGFRYVSLEGIAPEDCEVSAFVLSSDLRKTGTFTCSDPRLCRLEENIRWSARSNLMDIPTDCPQRDERMGWTGDIGLFASTGAYEFDLNRFLEKWLLDVKAEQLKTGGLPTTIPAQGYGFPVTMPKLAVDFWGDACLYVPLALYHAYGNEDILREMYPTMRKYVKACAFWAKIWGVGKYRCIWHTPSMIHFGDWVAPDAPKMSEWQKRSRYTATASLAHTSELLSEVAGILGKKEDEEEFHHLSQKVKAAYVSVFMKEGKLKKKEFQTAYVLPLAFHMLSGKEKDEAVAHLVELIEKQDYCIGTGFPGTRFILFALADNGRADVAYRMLLNEKCPSWLYEVKTGATTIWEKFDGLNPDGTCKKSADGTHNMVSFNHYSSGSVGAFLYERIVGITPKEPGYHSFQVKPLPGGNLTSAKGTLESPYGTIVSDWKIEGNEFRLHVEVPVNTTAEVVLPSGAVKNFGSGSYDVAETVSAQ